MSNQIEQAYEDDGSDEWLEANDNSQALAQLEQEDFQQLLDNDPEYHVWSDNLDAEYIAHINQMAEIELERAGGGMTLEAWDK